MELQFLCNNKSVLYFPSLSRPRKLHFSAIFTLLTTVSPPLRPPRIPEITSVTPPPPAPIPTPSTSEFHEKILYLDSLGLDTFSLIDNYSQIILSSSLTNIKSTVDFMTIEMKFTAYEFQRIVSMCPEIISSTVSDLIPIFTFLLREAHVNGSEIKKVINRRPRLLASSVKQRLRPTLYFLQSIGITKVNKHTYLLSCSVEEKLIPRIEYLEKLGFSERDTISMFRRFPQLFNYSIKENLEPKFNYFVIEMARDLKELKEFPQYFSFSLEKRIKHRHRCCLEKGLCFGLPLLLKSSDEEFVKRLEICSDSSMPVCSSPLWNYTTL